MSITALEIQEVRFGEVKKGYDPNEVDEFLERVAADVDTLNRALSEAATRIKAAETRAQEAERRAEQAISKARETPAPVAAAAPVKPKDDDAVSEEIIAKAFIAAQKSAEALQEEARKEAERIYREAESKGRDIVREALSEKQKTLSELDRLRESSESFRTEYLSLLKHFQADAQKRLAAFDDVIPSKETADDARKARERLTAANSAVIPAPGDPRDLPASGVAGSGLAAGAGLSPIQPPASSLQLEDEELDIEEID
ncbi:MAG: DivIVA domain-containing protein [Coriobacteriales bacterium]|jgi:cell division initiation protein|nr:DivIVA domain-containing protein [Coriobacteriales bacterium]